jgi:hypothetical protein
MKYSNKYHKYTGFAQKRDKDALTYEAIKTPFKFDYADDVLEEEFKVNLPFPLDTFNLDVDEEIKMIWLQSIIKIYMENYMFINYKEYIMI